MPREIVLSSFFAAAAALILSVDASAQNAQEPSASPEKPTSEAVVPAPLASPTPGAAPQASPEKLTAEPLPTASGTSSEAQKAAESVTVPAAEAAPDASLFSDPIKVEPLPPDMANGPDTSSSEPVFKKSKNAVVKDEVKERVRYRQVRTQVMADPKVQAEWDIATTAKTDPERRDALTKYYTKFYDRVESIDPSLKERAEADRANAMHRLTQRRLRAAGETASGQETPEEYAE